jgi:hypothetical protein
MHNDALPGECQLYSGAIVSGLKKEEGFHHGTLLLLHVFLHREFEGCLIYFAQLLA